MKIIDLSVPMDNQAKEPFPPKIEYDAHEKGAEQAAEILGLEATDFPDGKAWAVENVTLTTHTGTHVDAPWHYAPFSEGRKARTIDELPLEWFFGNGVLFDFSNKAPGYELQVEDFEAKLQEMNYELKPYDIVLIRTDADKNYYQENYVMSHAGASAEATRWLIEKGIKVMGTDGWGWDIPLPLQAEQYRQTKADNILWAAHFVGKEKEYCQIEKLANLDQLPSPTGFKVACFPVKISGASAGWARPVAIFD
ncbi:cyclase family protein [Pseudogracilibacillus auburnensis]|uniref:Kynurenine formamidase n=1 Tax=Pseudogracilibacillus auburnensis TaxID=1494959 RepID=A0A2V3W4U6_9BACI|nr:cyclase family protein [Pseudogracilibacillus auburnensis]PXW89373.1 kynurenine formamidase [Pseudogracilibacillus auburnensis]